MAAPLMAKRSTRTRRTKSCALNLASSALKVSTIAPSSPAAASKRNLASSGVSRNSGSSGSKNARGCGSKVSAAEGLPSAPARANAAAITALWPRCTPSKLPMATVAPRSAAAGAKSRTTGKVFAGIGRSPDQFAHHAARLDAGGGEHRVEGRQIRCFARTVFFGVNPRGNEHTIQTQGGGTLEIGPHRIPNGEHSLIGQCLGVAQSGRGSERELIDRRVRLAAIEHIAAEFGIRIGERAGAIHQRIAALDNDVGIGADHEPRSCAQRLEQLAIVLRRLDRVVEQTRAHDIVGGFRWSELHIKTGENR